MAAQLSLFEDVPAAFGLVGDTPEIHRVLRVIHKLKHSRVPVLVLGESGTGKELVARALHDVAPGERGTFLAVNLAAMAPTLLESELFGHARGAFTGAVAARRGLFEAAHGGTLFLDEIGEFPLELQAKLLRVLEEKQVRPVGAERAVAVDTRVIAATNRNLARETEQGLFRADLYYRLNVLSIRLPPLRERREDIALLVRHFLALHAPPGVRVAGSALEWMRRYDWPGNIRQLENAIQKMVALASGSELEIDDLPTQLRNALESAAGAVAREVPAPASVVPLAQQEKMAIAHALEVCRGDCRQAAQRLGMGRTTLYRKIKEYGLVLRP